jgi:IPT/TIG domain
MGKILVSSLCWLALVLQLGCGSCTQQPVITSISPSSATARGAQFVLKVNGNDFVRGAQVNWNGVARMTSFVSSHQLLASISAVDIAQPGTVLVSVFNPPQNVTTISGAIGNPMSVCKGKLSSAVVFTIANTHGEVPIVFQKRYVSASAGLVLSIQLSPWGGPEFCKLRTQ